MSFFSRQKTEQVQTQPQIIKVERIDNFARLHSSPEYFPYFLSKIKTEDLPQVSISMMLEETLEETPTGLMTKEFVIFPIEDLYQTKSEFEINTHTVELLSELPESLAKDFSNKDASGVCNYGEYGYCGRTCEGNYKTQLKNVNFNRFISHKGSETFRNKNQILILETDAKYETRGKDTYTLTSYNVTPALQICLEKTGLGVAAVTHPAQSSLHNILHKYDVRIDPALEIVFPKKLADKYKKVQEIQL